MSKKLHIDIETYSSIDIRKAGAYRYAQSIDFEIMLVAYAYDDEPVQIVDLMVGEELPQTLIDDLLNPFVTKYAHNAQFERRCFVESGFDLGVYDWFCTAVKAAYCGLPLSLDQVSSALKLGDKGKMAEGKKLIQYFCVPCKPTKTNGGRHRNFPEHDSEAWQLFKDYCVQDVVAEREICRRLERYKIPEFERENYGLDQIINDRGVLLDLGFAANAVAFDSRYLGTIRQEIKHLTGVDNPNSGPQLKTWLSEQTGLEITSLAKDVIGPLIEQVGADTVPGKVLQLRSMGSKTSTAKFKAMPICAGPDGRGRGLLQFYGAGRTGRWAGRLIQLQNLPRNYIKDLDGARQLVASGDYDSTLEQYPKMSGLLSQLIRTALIAPEGKTFAVADFSSIEARVIAWLAGEDWRLDVFRGDGRIYEASASMMFGLPIEQCLKEDKGGLPGIRAKGKIAELALGYQGGVGALRQMGGESMGLSADEMQSIVEKWREASPNIKKLWYTVEKAAKATMRTRKTIETKCGRLRFKFNGETLRIKLPSGRCLSYWKAHLGEGKFGEVIKYWGVNQTLRKWMRLETYGGKLVENIVQAIARDLLMNSMQHLEANGFRIVMHVHDEAICEVPVDEAEVLLENMCFIMGQGPDWAQGLPLGADGYVTPYYKKD